MNPDDETHFKSKHEYNPAHERMKSHSTKLPGKKSAGGRQFMRLGGTGMTSALGSLLRRARLAPSAALLLTTGAVIFSVTATQIDAKDEPVPTPTPIATAAPTPTPSPTPSPSPSPSPSPTPRPRPRPTETMTPDITDPDPPEETAAPETTAPETSPP